MENMAASILNRQGPRKLKLEKVEALEALKFSFGDNKYVSPLFAHQNFKVEKIEFPEELLPLEIPINRDPYTLKVKSIDFVHEESSMPKSSALDKVKGVIKARILKAHFGAENKPAVAYSHDDSPDPQPDHVFNLTCSSGDTLKVEQYSGGWKSFPTWRRAEWLMLFFVDAASQVDADTDEKWEILIGRDSTGKIACLASIFNFPTFGKPEPITRRQRLAQFITLPCSWGKGYGEALVTFLHERAMQNDSVDKLTMEDPSEGMFNLRDVVVIRLGLKRGLIANDCLRTKTWPKPKVWQKLKIPYVAARRVCEALQVGAAEDGEKSADPDFGPLTDLRSLVKQRIKRMLDDCDGYPEEVDAIEDAPEKEDAQGEYIQEEWESFVDSSLRTIKKLFS